jgi:predicted RNase H-like nuclease (RuvC/YqgF family)
MRKSELYEKEIKELNKQLYNSYKRIKELNDKKNKGDK